MPVKYIIQLHISFIQLLSVELLLRRCWFSNI